MKTLTVKVCMALGMMAAIVTCTKAPEEKEIKFVHQTWEEVKALAKKEKKIIFMDAYTEWCGPCKMMAAKVFTDSTVAAFYNKNFINTKFDMEKGEGKDLAKQYRVWAFPTFLFINSDGELVHRSCGYMPPDAFIEAGRDALDPDKQLIGYQKKYDAGNRDGQFLYGYLNALERGCANTDDVKNEYFKTQKESALSERVNWNIMYNFENDPASPAFLYLLSHQDEFAGKYTADSVNGKIYDVLLRDAMMTIYRDTTGQALAAIRKKNENVKFARKDEWMLDITATYYKKNKDYNNYGPAVVPLVEKYKMNDADYLNNVAYEFYENINDKTLLEKALQWAKRSVELNKKSHNTDTYASLLFKLGKKAEAIEQEEMAIKLAKEEGVPYDDLVKTLESFKK